MEPEKSDKIEKPKETVYAIEKMAELKEKLWRAVREGKRSIRYYTQPSGMDKPKTNKKTKKAERQNRRKGRK